MTGLQLWLVTLPAVQLVVRATGRREALDLAEAHGTLEAAEWAAATATLLGAAGPPGALLVLRSGGRVTIVEGLE